MFDSFKDRIVLQHSTESVADEKGETSLVFSTYATVWASVNTLSVRESLQTNTPKTLSSHKIKVRYREDVRQGDRILFKDRILSVNEPIQEGNYLLILATEQIKEELEQEQEQDSDSGSDSV